MGISKRFRVQRKRVQSSNENQVRFDSMNFQELNQNSFMFFSRKNGQSTEKREKLTDNAEYNLGNVFVSEDRRRE